MKTKFKTFLAEEKEIISRIKSDCKQFINESGGFPMFRGLEQIPLAYMKTKPISSARDSSRFLTNVFNFYIEEKFGYKAIRTVNRFYAAGDAPQLTQYGNLYYVFPKDKYNFVWSNLIQDATSDLEKIIKSKIEISLQEQEASNEAISNIFDNFKKLIAGKEGQSVKEFKKEEAYLDLRLAIDEAFDEYEYQNNDLKNALKSGNEIIIQTEGYYTIPCIENEDDDEAYGETKYWSQIRKDYKAIYESLK